MLLLAQLLDRARAQIDFARLAPGDEKRPFIERARALVDDARAELGRHASPSPSVPLAFLSARRTLRHLDEDLAALERSAALHDAERRAGVPPVRPTR